MIVRFMAIDTTVPVRILPRIETSPVKGNFLSGYLLIGNRDTLLRLHINVVSVYGSSRGFDTKSNVAIESRTPLARPSNAHTLASRCNTNVRLALVGTLRLCKCRHLRVCLFGEAKCQIEDADLQTNFGAKYQAHSV